ncbi:GIY-YIG nuclease family protein [Vreelandella alkaliphila]|uniref:GIY-YIG nuclease family protein n=1 Tax=Vreelandella alkaliphila TaxID=272774 RepID=UPI003FD72BBF
MQKQPCVYIMASGKRGTLYIGVTSNLAQRAWQHKQQSYDGFTARYAINQLVYFEQASDMETAIKREKQLKKWNRAWKIQLIENHNPHWKDLYPDIL